MLGGTPGGVDPAVAILSYLVDEGNETELA